MHAEAAEWFHDNLLKKEFAEPARDYLKKRGIDRQVAKDWQLGFAPDSWDAFLKWALDRGYSRTSFCKAAWSNCATKNSPAAKFTIVFAAASCFRSATTSAK